MTNEESKGAGPASVSTDLLCGCGREVRYMTRTGMACNKYRRCPTYEEQGEALKAANARLLNWLALIHGDGGHHVLAVGFDQAMKDAEKILYRWREAYYRE